MKKKVDVEKQRGMMPYILSGLVLLVGILAYWNFGKNRATEEIPDYLEGSWSTTAPRYKDRFLDISKVMLFLTTGKDSSAEYFISNTTRSVDAGRELFTVDCKNSEGDEYRFVFFYLPDNGGTLYFKNQPEVKWTKETL